MDLTSASIEINDDTYMADLYNEKEDKLKSQERKVQDVKLDDENPLQKMFKLKDEGSVEKQPIVPRGSNVSEIMI